MYLDLILRWVHILAAITMVGGLFFIRFALIPGINEFNADQQAAIRAGVRQFWSKCVMATSGLLLLSGLVNAIVQIMRYEFDGPYHGLVAAKLLVALAIFWFASVLSGKSSAAEQFRKKERFWLNVLVTLSVVIVCIGGFMKMQNRTPKPKDETQQTSQIRPADSVPLNWTDVAKS